MRMKVFAFFKSLSLNRLKKTEHRHSIQLSTVPLIYIRRLDVHHIPRLLVSKRFDLIKPKRSSRQIVLWVHGLNIDTYVH
jgi:hypothetical protein